VDVFGVVAGQDGYLRDAAVRAAAELRLADALPGTADDAACALHLKGARRLRRLLDVLALFGFARREGDAFSLAGLPCAAPIPAGGWGQLAEVIRLDRPAHEPGVAGTGPGEALQRFHDYLFAAGREPARELWETLAGAEGQALPAAGGAWRAGHPIGPLLDLGGGAGAYAAAFPGDATIADTPGVLALAQAPRAKRLPIDLLRDGYPGDQGVVLLANVLHLFGEPDCRVLVRKAAGALRPGGLLVVKDLFVEPDRSGPREGVLFALNMALFTEQGDVHDAPLATRFILDAGLQKPRRLSLNSSPGSLVLVAAKP